MIFFMVIVNSKKEKPWLAKVKDITYCKCARIHVFLKSINVMIKLEYYSKHDIL